MMKYMFALVGLVFSLPLMASDVTLCGGKKGGSYWDTMTDVSARLNLSGEWDVEVLETAGGLENLVKMASGACVAGMAQDDTQFNWMNTAGEASSNIVPAGVAYAECAVIAYNKSHNKKPLEGEGFIAVGRVGGGSADFLKTIATLEDDYTAKPDNTPVVARIGSLASRPGSDVDGILAVSRCGVTSRWHTQAVQQGLKLAGVWDMDLNDKHPVTGKPIYTKVKTSMGGSALKTAAVNASFWMNEAAANEIDPKLAEALYSAFLDAGEK